MATSWPSATIADQPRAIGTVRLKAMQGRRGTEVAELRQSGSLKLVFPRAAPDLQAVIVNTAGGITGGDRFDIDLATGPEARLCVTTQAAERAYRAQPRQTGRLTSLAKISSGARVDWLPQETILFDGCALSRSLTVEMAKDATLLMVEPLVFGRAAMGEALHSASFDDRIEVRRDGRLIYLDRTRLQGDVTAHLARAAVADGAGAMATILYVAGDAERHLSALRDLLDPTAGASLIRPGVLACRMLAPDSYLLRRSLIPALTLLGGQDLPRPWMM